MRTIARQALLFFAVIASAVLASAALADGDPELRLAEAIRAFQADSSTVTSFHSLEGPERFAAEEAADAIWRSWLAGLPFESLATAGRIDYLLLEALLDRRAADLARRRAEYAKALPLAGWHDLVLEIEAAHRDGGPFEYRRLAERLGPVPAAVAELRAHREAFAGSGPLVRRVSALARADADFLTGWYGQHADHDPLFGWWLEQPLAAARDAIRGHADFLDGEVLPEIKKTENAFAVGAEALDLDLRLEFLPYTAETLLADGERWFAETREDLVRTAELVHPGGTWQEALADIKADQVEIGSERAYVHALATESIEFVRAKRLVPLPPLVEKWSLVSIDRDAQRTYPFAYYSGNRMGWSYAVRSQSQEVKEAALRGNNRYVTRTVVPHELIPGHHLQTFYADRHRTHRAAFRSSVLVEGWGFYTELLFDQMGWFRTPKERLGHLHWKLIRAARIVVTLRYHLSRMKQSEMVDFLVNEVGLERDGAQGEVDRYMTYSPLYQASYMVGARQIVALREEAKTVAGQGFDLEEFHRRLLEQNSIPIAMSRYAVLDFEVPRHP